MCDEALANKDERGLTVSFQADGSLMYNPGALCTAADHRIPRLSVTDNARSYYKDGQQAKDIVNVVRENQSFGRRSLSC